MSFEFYIVYVYVFYLFNYVFFFLSRYLSTIN